MSGLNRERSEVLLLDSEHLLFSYLDEHLNANGSTPHLAGLDANGVPFLAWLNEEGGDSAAHRRRRGLTVYLTVTRLVESDGGTYSNTSEETPGQGATTSLVYPVEVLA